jgi:protein-tyrosine phosphatase
MIDLHCHILPGIDDGARDLDDSLAMARAAADDGIEIVCATPHIRHDHDVRIRELRGRADELNEEIRRAGIPVEVVTGGELAETALEGLDPEELQAISLGGGGWILLEPAPGPLGASLAAATSRLLQAGFGVLIAHPERHPSADLPDRLRELSELGALIQVTAALLAEGPARPSMLSLADRGLVHVVASDAHSSHAGRPLRLSDGLAALEGVELVSPHLAWVAREAPAAIVSGERPQVPF